MSQQRLEGLIAATYSPLTSTGAVDVALIPPMLEQLLSDGVTGVYVCGSTGEGMSLTREERMQVTAAWVSAVNGRIPVIVQVGHNCLNEARLLARHAQEVGADIVSATCPSYFKVTSVDALVACMAEVAGGAPDLPFYYYHIPGLTGARLDMPEFLQAGSTAIPNLQGLKYTDTALHEFQQCLELHGGQFDVVWGCDEMLLGALATGAAAAIGSTYNIAAPLYRQLIAAFVAGDLPAARQHQSRAISMIRTIYQYPFHPAMKAVLRSLGLDLGICRLPQQPLPISGHEQLLKELQAIGFFEWGRTDTPTVPRAD